MWAILLVAIRVARTGENHLRLGQGVAKLICVERFQEIILDAARQQIAIQANIIHLTGSDNDRSRLAHFCEAVNVIQRIAAFG